MHRVNHHFHLQQTAADVAAAASVAGASWSWVTQANDLLQLIATAVAIGVGFYAARYHRTRYSIMKEYESRGEFPPDIKDDPNP